MAVGVPAWPDGDGGDLLAARIGLCGGAPLATAFVWTFVGIAVRQRDPMPVIIVAWISVALAAFDER